MGFCKLQGKRTVLKAALGLNIFSFIFLFIAFATPYWFVFLIVNFKLLETVVINFLVFVTIIHSVKLGLTDTIVKLSRLLTPAVSF